MSDDILDAGNWLDEFGSLPEASILLEPKDIDRAIELSQRVRDEGKRWQTYLSAIALIGFEHWIRQEAPEISFNQNRCMILEPASASTPTAVCNLVVNGFKICLVTVGGFMSDLTFVPATVIDSIDVAAQFYVPVIVDEESQRVTIHGFLRRDQIQPSALPNEEQGFYPLPTEWFNANLDRLLLFFSCLEPTAIPISAFEQVSAITVTQPAQILATSAIRLRQWFSQRWNEIVDSQSRDVVYFAGHGGRADNRETANWVIFPPGVMAGAIRSIERSLAPEDVKEISGILTALKRNGMRIPRDQSAGYRNIEYADLSLRLYMIPDNYVADNSLEVTTLLFVLKLRGGKRLPLGLHFQIRDDSSVIAERSLDTSNQADFLFCRVSCTANERLMISLKMDDLPPLTLEPLEL